MLDIWISPSIYWSVRRLLLLLLILGNERTLHSMTMWIKRRRVDRVASCNWWVNIILSKRIFKTCFNKWFKGVGIQEFCLIYHKYSANIVLKSNLIILLTDGIELNRLTHSTMRHFECLKSKPQHLKMRVIFWQRLIAWPTSFEKRERSMV